MENNVKDSKTTYAKIAKEANVSIATVSRVINHREQVSEDTVKQVLGAIRSLGSTLAQTGGNENKCRCIVVLLPIDNHSFSAAVIEGMKAASNYYRYQLLIIDDYLFDSNVENYINLVEQGVAAGFLLLSVANKSALEKLQMYAPVVQCCEHNTDVDVSYVEVDNRAAMREMTSYLLHIGKKDIIYINVDNELASCSKLRLYGYKDALETFGVDFQQDNVITLPAFDYRLARSEHSRVLEDCKKLPDCIFCSSDIFAAAALKVCNTKGILVPENIFIVGFDNIELSSMLTPSITTVSQPCYEIGYTGLKYLIEQIENPQIPLRKTLLEGEIVLRDSTTLRRIQTQI